ncbi:YbaB/EbfC family nucleoid-associated protein [Saccharothrix australiensis]|uniref:DNA-binding protein YbaB n=1 Tax=Saccharothrix australiensis TaxID=2072 RepID=A0A495W6H2_9PSEU|nr:YbaB/EbfC family nucleoid-associated protein [Saccharothrix australiensis]RKT57321.1 DNA-binding protein YbaB [Saccharothrix australiensis]
MDGNILDPDGARERLATWKGRIDKLASDTKAMSERLQAIRVTVGDPNGLVEVTVDSTGSLVDLRLTERMQRTAPDLVSRTIMATIREAKTKVADRSQEIIAETVGTESPAGRAIADNVGRHLRGGPAPERRTAPVDDDEGFDGRSYLRDE